MNDLADLTGLKKKKRGGGLLSGRQEMNEREKSCLPSALLQSVPRSIVLHPRESENEREQARRT